VHTMLTQYSAHYVNAGSRPAAGGQTDSLSTTLFLPSDSNALIITGLHVSTLKRLFSGHSV